MRLPTLHLRHVWLMLPLTLGVMVMGLLPLRAWDYWWHLVAGQWGAWSGEVLQSNLFLYTLPKHDPSLSQPWLAQRMLYMLHEEIGLSGALLVRNGLVGAALLTLTVELRKQHTTPPMLAFSLLAALPFMMATMTLRTHLFAWPLFLLVIVGMRRLRRAQESSLWLVCLVPIAALWAQLHSSFLLPSALIVMWIAARFTDVKRRWKTNPRTSTVLGCVALAGLCALGPLLHPAGLVTLYTSFGDMVKDGPLSEWMLTTPARHPVVAPLLYAWLLVGAWFFFQRRRMCDRLDLILFFGFGICAVLHTSCVLWFALIAPLTLTPYLPGSIEDIVKDEDVPIPLQVVYAVLIALLAASAILTQPGIKTRRMIAPLVASTPIRMEEPFAMIVTQDTPLDAMAWLVDHREHRRLFHDQRWAGLILWTLIERDGPTRMVFVDQRHELPGEQVWGLYESISQARSAWRLQLEAHHVTSTLIDPVNQQPLHDALSKDDLWHEVIITPEYTLFARPPYEEAP